MAKKGLSDIVTIVLIILIALALILLLWGFFRSSLQKSGSQIDVGVLLTKVSCLPESVLLNQEIGQLNLTLKREAGSGNLIGYTIVLTDINKKSIPFRFENNLSELETIRRTIDFSGLSNISSIDVVPLIRGKSGNELQGRIISSCAAIQVESSQSCIPKTCADYLNLCGSTFDDGCRGTISCGCSSDSSCVKGRCDKFETKLYQGFFSSVSEPNCTPSVTYVGAKGRNLNYANGDWELVTFWVDSANTSRMNTSQFVWNSNIRYPFNLTFTNNTQLINFTIKNITHSNTMTKISPFYANNYTDILIGVRTQNNTPIGGGIYPAVYVDGLALNGIILDKGVNATENGPGNQGNYYYNTLRVKGADPYLQQSGFSLSGYVNFTFNESLRPSREAVRFEISVINAEGDGCY